MSARPLNTARPDFSIPWMEHASLPPERSMAGKPPGCRCVTVWPHDVCIGPQFLDAIVYDERGEMMAHAGSTHGKSTPRPNISSLLARAERAILARERALARFKAACACALVGLDFMLLKGLRERRVDRCARPVRESYAEIAALVQAWRELYEKVSGGSR